MVIKAWDSDLVTTASYDNIHKYTADIIVSNINR